MNQIIFHQMPIEEIKAIIVEAVAEQFKKSQSNRTEPEELFNRKKTAAYFGCSLPTLNEYTKTGIIKAVRIGNSIRYRKEDIEKAIAEVITSKSK